MEKKNRIDEIEQQIEEYDRLLLLGRKLLQELESVEAHGGILDRNDFFAHLSPEMMDAIEIAEKESDDQNKEKTKKWIETEREKAGILAQELAACMGGRGKKGNYKTGNPRSDRSSILIDDLADNFIKHKITTKAWKPVSTKGNTEMIRVLVEYLKEMKGNDKLHISNLDVDDAIKFQAEFQGFPANYRKIHPDRSIKDIVDLMQDGKIPSGNTISDLTYNNYAGLLSAMFDFAKDKRQRYIVSNVFEDIKIKTSRNKRKRPPFTNDDLRKFFNSDIYSLKQFSVDWSWRYWVPIIMLYSGMRLEEVCQLRIKNIIKENGVDCFELISETDQAGNIITTLKNENSVRNVPIHPVLINLGFLSSYVSFLDKSGQDKLFPNLSNMTADGHFKKAGAKVSKWFNEDNNKHQKSSYFSRQGIDKSKGLVLYCLRHTVETLLNNHSSDIENDKIDTLLGHDIASTGRNTYGGYSTDTLLRVVEVIDYPGAQLPWDVNPGYQDMRFPWE